MTPQEAIERIDLLIGTEKLFIKISTMGEISHSQNIEALEMAKKAVEKQIAKKPNRTDWKDLPASQVLWKRDRISCPNCNWELLSTWDGGLRYCYHCGQALDWGDDK